MISFGAAPLVSFATEPRARRHHLIGARSLVAFDWSRAQGLPLICALCWEKASHPPAGVQVPQVLIFLFHFIYFILILFPVYTFISLIVLSNCLIKLR